MIYGSVCSGIEAATVAWHPLGWKPAFFSEIEAFPRTVLQHHYADIPLHGDFTTIGADDYGAIDLLVGGTPCQDFSIAGLRAGLDGARGQLTLEFLRLADRLRPRWVVWENVPGVLSANNGRAFGAFLGGLEELGYGWAYRALDAQYFGLPQRRRRVFVVGCLGNANAAAAVLLERASLSGHPAPRRKARKDIAGTLGARTSAGGGFGTDFELDGGQTAVARGNTDYVNSITQHVGAGVDENMARDGWLIAHALRAEGNDLALPVTQRNGDPDMIAFSCKDYGADASEIAPTLRAMEHDGSHANAGAQVAIAFNLRGREDGSQAEVDAARTYVASSAVRRLTPRECERLQGFPDDYTDVPYRGKPAADGPRYRALGNSMAVPVMRWFGERIEFVAGILATSQRGAA